MGWLSSMSQGERWKLGLNASGSVGEHISPTHRKLKKQMQETGHSIEVSYEWVGSC